MSTKFVQARRALLQSAISDTATSMTVTEFLDLSGNPIVAADIGTVGYGTLAPNTAKEEAISFTIDSNTAGVAVLTITRGLLGKQPYGTGGTAYAHNAGTEFILSNNPDLLNKLTAKDNDEVVTGGWRFPATPTHDQNPVPKKYLEDNAVMKTGAQTVAGVKTFSDSPVIPDADADNEPTSKGQVDVLDAANVKLTGDQTVAGVKTFSSAPIVPDAAVAQNPITKAQYDAGAAAYSADASPTVQGAVKIDTAADDVNDPVALTATAARAAALSGGGEFGTPSVSNKFLTEDYIATDVQTFTSSGTWTKPSKGNWAFIEVWGAGGSGGARGSDGDGQDAAGGGAGGEYISSWFKLGYLGSTETITIGSGGASVAVANAGNSGGSSSFGDWLVAEGGAGGAMNFSVTAAAGGSGSTSILNHLLQETGGAGAGFNDTAGAAGSTKLAGAGGGSAGDNGPIHNVYSFSVGGTSDFGGDGGSAGTSRGAAGSAGVQPGGGGGAAQSASSGAGADGQVKVTVYNI